MKILLLGKNGQLGQELQRYLPSLGEVTALGRTEADLGRPEHLRRAVRRFRPQIIVNAAAYTDVDQAESEPDLAMQVNGLAPGLLAEEASALRAILFHYSTDYVFDGAKNLPYTEEDIPNPINMYGHSKLEGEHLVLSASDSSIILRTSWVYSLRQKGGFVNKVLGWARQNEILRIVEDQVGSPTWAGMLARLTVLLIARGGGRLYDYIRQRHGVYHLAGKGGVSRLEWAQAILRYDPRLTEQTVKKLEPALSAEFPTAAIRPSYSALSCDRFETTFGLQIPGWEESLRSAMQG